MSKQTAMAGIQRAAELMNSDYFNQLVESKAPHGNKRGTARSTGGTSLSSDLASFEAQAGLASTAPSRNQQFTLSEGKELPDFQTIKASMQKMPTPSIDTSMINPAYVQQQQQPRQMIAESYQQPMAQPSYAAQGIDYNYIKYLVNECIKENLATQLNESANLGGIRMVGGNKIQLIDTKGNIYEGTLTLKKRANQ